MYSRILFVLSFYVFNSISIVLYANILYTVYVFYRSILFLSSITFDLYLYVYKSIGCTWHRKYVSFGGKTTACYTTLVNIISQKRENVPDKLSFPNRLGAIIFQIPGKVLGLLRFHFYFIELETFIWLSVRFFYWDWRICGMNWMILWTN